MVSHYMLTLNLNYDLNLNKKQHLIH